MTIETRAKIREMRIAVTYSCNLGCQHCYVPEMNRLDHQRQREGEQLDVEEIETFLDMLVANFGTERISITGGEPLLRPVWPRTRRTLRHALNRGLQVRLITSGSGQVDIEEAVSAAGGSNNLTLQVSLDGVNEEKVDSFRGKRGAMRNALATIRKAIAVGLPVRVRYTATENNWEETILCYDLVTDMGVSAFVVKPMFAAGQGRLSRHLLVDGNELRSLQLSLVARSVGRSTKLVLPQPCYVDPGEVLPGANVEIMYCACGSEVAYLSANGDIYPCTYMVGAPGCGAWKIGNIRDPHFDLQRLWSDPNTYAEFRQAERHGNCAAQNIMNRLIEAERATQSG